MKKGFTLIEIIGVILLLCILALIAIPRVVEEIEKAKNLATEQQINMLKESALLYSVKFDLGYDDNITKTIDFDSLINSGFLKEDSILNEKGNRIEGCLSYKWFNNSNQYEFWYEKKCN